MEVDDQIQAIQDEIDRLDREERKLELELKDVLTDIDTPHETDDEEEDEYQENDMILVALRARLLAVSGAPTRPCEYLERFQDPVYRRNTRRKVIRLKNSVRTSRISTVLRQPEFLTHLQRIQRTYPDNGGRSYLNELVAYYCTLNQE